MTRIVLVAVGGGLGALSRYGATLLAVQIFGSRFPWGTLIVNLAGCFLIGLSFALADRGLNIMNPSARLFFVTGYLGGLTTFSTFAMETVNSLRSATYLIALANFLFNNVIGGALVFLGLWVGKLR
jgi:fluoride exporter